MRVLLTTVDWTGHLFPMVPTAWGLQAAGHQVRVLCSARLAPSVAAAGLVPVPRLSAGGVVEARINAYQRAREGRQRAPGLPVLHPLSGKEMRSLDEFDLERFTARFGSGHAQLEHQRRNIIAEFVLGWRPDLVLHDLSSVDGRLAAEIADVPAVAHLWGFVADAEQDNGLDYRAERVDAAFERFRLQGRGARITHVIDPSPGEMEPPTLATRLPIRFVPYNGAGLMPKWLLVPRSRPRITVVWGTSVTKVYGRKSFLAPKIAEAMAAVPADVVLAVPAGDMPNVGSLPPNVVLLKQRAPLHLLLGVSDVVVHNGAAGSAMTALAAGVPQLVLSISDEQAGNGARVAATGAGLHANGPATDTAAIRDAVSLLLDDAAPRASAARLAAQNRSRPAPAALVPQLADLAGAASLQASSTQV